MTPPRAADLTRPVLPVSSSSVAFVPELAQSKAGAARPGQAPGQSHLKERGGPIPCLHSPRRLHSHSPGSSPRAGWRFSDRPEETRRRASLVRGSLGLGSSHHTKAPHAAQTSQSIPVYQDWRTTRKEARAHTKTCSVAAKSRVPPLSLLALLIYNATMTQFVHKRPQH